MLKVTEDNGRLEVTSRSIVLGAVFFCALVLLIVRQGATMFADEAATSELIGGLLGIAFCVASVYYLVEFSTFTFCKSDGLLAWRSRRLFRHRSGQVPLTRIARVRREALMSTDGGYASTYRLVVVTTDDEIIPLTRSFSGTQDQQLDDIVQQVRAYLGMPPT